MCPYPEVARYLGEGSIDEAENFVCAEPVAAKVRVMPSTMKLNDGEFTAVIKAPKGLHLCGFENVAVVCEGALADKVKLIFYSLKNKVER